MYTVQVCCSAIRNFLPMYVVFKGKHLYNNWCKGAPDDTLYNCSASGWMEGEQFVEWMEKVFIAGTSHLEESKLLIFDGHSSHISSRVVDLAQQNNVELLCMPAHTSSVLQPLDVGVFKGVKVAWRKCLREHYDDTRFSNVDKRTFPVLLKQLVDNGAFSKANAISGFESCGIHPLNRQKITSDKLATSVPLTHVNTTNNTPLTLSTASVNCSSQISPSTSSILAPLVSPRKSIENAILSHLKQITPTSTNDKRVRIKRTLAECLASEEASKRALENEEKRKSKTKQKVAIGLKISAITSGCPVVDKANSTPTARKRKLVISQRKYKPTVPKENKSRRPVFDQSKVTVRKPIWLDRSCKVERIPVAIFEDVEPLTSSDETIDSPGWPTFAFNELCTLFHQINQFIYFHNFG